MSEMRLCRGECGKELPFSNFYLRNGRPYQSRCKDCHNAKMRLRLKEDHAYREKNFFYANTRNIGLDPTVLWPLYKAHSGLCDICGQPPKGKRTRLCVDHNHATGEFRGFTCNNCNVMLGNAMDNPDLLMRGASYLRQRGHYGV